MADPQVEMKTLNTGITVQLINQYSAFEKIKNDWNNLVERSQFDSIFLRHEWFDAAWQWRKADSQLHILAIILNNQLIGICPFVMSKKRQRIGKIRCLEFLTVPDTMHCDIIFEKKNRSVAIRSLMTWFQNNKGKWELVDLRYFPELSPTPLELKNFAPSIGLKTYQSNPDYNHFIALNTSWEEFYKTKSRRLKKGNNLVANHLKRAGNIRVEWIRDPEQVMKSLPDVINISASSWKKKTKLTLDQPLPGTFIQKLSKLSSTQGWLSIWLLYLDDVPIASEYQLTYRGCNYALRADYDESYAKLSPGTYMNWQLLQQLFNSSHTCYYLGRGDNSYKLRWSDTSEKMPAMVMYGSTVRGKILLLIEQYIRPFKHAVVKLINNIKHSIPSFTGK
ncbi:GNAT family N-acetyltransferase [Beggiatoa alba]|nr:GNAT family N-acetyltransferase [Beggiatoa alba]